MHDVIRCSHLHPSIPYTYALPAPNRVLSSSRILALRSLLYIDATIRRSGMRSTRFHQNARCIVKTHPRRLHLINVARYANHYLLLNELLRTTLMPQHSPTFRVQRSDQTSRRRRSEYRVSVFKDKIQ